MITKEWKVSKVLEQYPDAVDIFVAASPHFSKLKNPVLRKVLALRVTVQQAAAIGGIAVEDLLRGLNAAIGEMHDVVKTVPISDDEEQMKEAERVSAAIVETVAPRGEVRLDVRPIIASGSDPLKVILKTVRDLKNGEVLHLINSFEPIPLYSVLGEKGFEHFTRKLNGAWHVYFYRKQPAESSLQQADDSRQSESNQSAIRIPHSAIVPERVVEIDVRGLAPPEPMMKILEKLAEVDEKTLLLVHHHREPMMLYEKLEQRGYAGATEKIREDYYKVVIRKKQR
ncbi:MAG TPA: DUF2249 domain-containing protein [Bacteroidota bacterium]